MGLVEITLIALGLSLDSFAVSLGAGTENKIENRSGDFRLAFHFGLFQVLMPISGWLMNCNNYYRWQRFSL